MALISVVIPAYGRPIMLRRALQSLMRQSHQLWECIVVDDASLQSLEPTVRAFEDDRLRYVRRATNGGPTAARRTAFDLARGEFLLCLDSDWELYPWTLARALDLLADHPAADIATGLCLRHDDSRLFVRVRDSPRLVSPDEFRRESPIPDRIALVRRTVVREWLDCCPTLFAYETVYWITASLHRSSINVDEPWCLYFTGGADHVTTAMQSCEGRDRVTGDAKTVLRECQQLLSVRPCVAVDVLASDIYFQLWRAREPEAAAARALLRQRGISSRRVILARVGAKARRHLPLSDSAGVTWA